MFYGQIKFNRLTPVLRSKSIHLDTVYSVTLDEDNLEVDDYFVECYLHSTKITRKYLRELFNEGNITIIKKR